MQKRGNHTVNVHVVTSTQYGTVPYRTCMHVFPLCGIRGIRLTVADTCKVKPSNYNPRYIFDQIYGMHTWGLLRIIRIFLAYLIVSHLIGLKVTIK